MAAQSSAEEVAFDQKRVLNRLDVLSRKAEELGQISAAARCEELIGKQRGMFVDRSALLWETDPDKMTPDQLDVIADHLLSRALGGNQRAVAEAQRLIEAGENPTIEDCMRVVEQEPGKMSPLVVASGHGWCRECRRASASGCLVPVHLLGSRALELGGEKRRRARAHCVFRLLP